MGTVHGNSGVVTIATNAVAHVKQFSISETVDYPDKSAMGAGARTYQTGGPVGASGDLECEYDQADANGQEVLAFNTEHAAVFYPDGNASGKPSWTCTILVQEMTLNETDNDIVRRGFRFLVQGAITKGLVS
jgi:hypothetical protein